MAEHQWLADQFEAHRAHMARVAYRLLGSQIDAEDAVQEAWIRVSRAGVEGIENLGGWLTTVVSRICLNMLQSRKTRREEPLDPRVPELFVSAEEGTNPEQEALLGDSVSLAMAVVLETLSPPERIAFVLHDVFHVSFDEIATMMQKSPAAARQLASRARRRIQGSPVAPDANLSEQRKVVSAFLAAARGGSFEDLLAVLDPNVVLRADGGEARPNVSRVLRGAEEVASTAILFSQGGATAHHVSINGAAGLLGTDAQGEPVALLAFTVAKGRIVAIEALADPERLGAMNLKAFAESLPGF